MNLIVLSLTQLKSLTEISSLTSIILTLLVKNYIFQNVNFRFLTSEFSLINKQFLYHQLKI